MGKKQFCFFQTAETGNRTPDSGVKGSGANHYPRAPALHGTKANGQIYEWNSPIYQFYEWNDQCHFLSQIQRPESVNNVPWLTPSYKKYNNV